MDNYDKFKEHVQAIASKFKEIPKTETIRLISHFDADGISSAALMIKLLNKENRKYTLSIIRQLTRDFLNELSMENGKVIVFTDLGSGLLSAINEVLQNKLVFVLDHHIVKAEDANGRVNFINPHLFGIDGTREISGAGVVYTFAKAVDKGMEDFAYVALLGAMGDQQEKNGFLKLNNEILETAVAKGQVKVIRGLRIFGAQTKPLYKVLEYCTDPYIPGVSGSESGSIQFLRQIGIEPKASNEWKKIVHLSEEELKMLVEGIIMKRLGMTNADDVLGNVYILKNEEKESPLRDLKEFSTLLNACGRMEKASLGIGACLGDQKLKDKAVRSMADYRKEIVNAMRWYEDNINTEQVTKGKGYIIINTKDQIMGTIVGTLASMISKSNDVENGTLILSMARIENMLKVSIRAAGSSDIDLLGIISKITDKVPGCEAGGHKRAAGAIAPLDMEDHFIDAAKEVLGRAGMEQSVD